MQIRAAGEAAETSSRIDVGLAGRVVALACSAAVVATVAQWLLTPLMSLVQFDRGRLVYAEGTSRQLAQLAADALQRGDKAALEKLAHAMAVGLPEAQASILDARGEVVASSTANPAADTRRPDLRLLAMPDGGAHIAPSGLLVGATPIKHDGARIGEAVYAMRARTVWAMWGQVVLLQTLVLVLALSVIAPFFIPLARRVLAPVSRLERRIRRLSPDESLHLSEGVADATLKPLLEAIDEAHAKSLAEIERALQRAYSDPVTDLANRVSFMATLEEKLRCGEATQLLLADIEGFGKVNLVYGPRVADDLLARVGQRFLAAAKAEQAEPIVGRLGGDTFGLLCPGTEAAAAEAVAAACREHLLEPIDIDGVVLRTSAAFASAGAPRDAQTAIDLLKQAERALKEAKHHPLRRAIFEPRMQDKHKRQSQLEAEIRRGVANGEFMAVFQPKVSLQTGAMVGAEALARWRRADGTVVSPGVFIPIAEELGLIPQLGEQVLRHACRAAVRWNSSRAEPVQVAVNVSALQFDDPDFIPSVYRALDDFGVDPRLLELEITESAAVADADRVARIMWPLRNRGVRLAIDDFGTGHSNFTSLTRLPFDVFKIDQQFVRALSTDSQAPAIVEMILAMAEALGQETVAEGVETREQTEFLTSRACTIGQGYYFSPPLPADEFDTFLRTYRPRPSERAA